MQWESSRLHTWQRRTAVFVIERLLRVFKMSPRCHLLTFKIGECDNERSFICPHKQYYPRAHCLPETAVSYCHYKAIFLLLSARTAATKLKLFSFHYMMYNSAPNCFLKSSGFSCTSCISLKLPNKTSMCCVIGRRVRHSRLFSVFCLFFCVSNQNSYNVPAAGLQPEWCNHFVFAVLTHAGANSNFSQMDSTHLLESCDMLSITFVPPEGLTAGSPVCTWSSMLPIIKREIEANLFVSFREKSILN